MNETIAKREENLKIQHELATSVLLKRVERDRNEQQKQRKEDSKR